MFEVENPKLHLHRKLDEAAREFAEDNPSYFYGGYCRSIEDSERLIELASEGATVLFHFFGLTRGGEVTAKAFLSTKHGQLNVEILGPSI